jgi:GH24 family phage-related lysozyme (muramidase)
MENPKSTDDIVFNKAVQFIKNSENPALAEALRKGEYTYKPYEKGPEISVTSAYTDVSGNKTVGYGMERYEDYSSIEEIESDLRRQVRTRLNYLNSIKSEDGKSIPLTVNQKVSLISLLYNSANEKNMVEPDSPDNSVFKDIAPNAYSALTKAGGPDLESLVFELFSPEAGITKGKTSESKGELIQIDGLVNRRKAEAMNDNAFAEIYNRLVTQ